jgi:hypothetical protein
MSSLSLWFENVAAGGANFDSILAAMDGVGDAIEAITTCVQATESLWQAITVKSALVPTDDLAHRESGLRVFYTDDTTGKVYHFTIPGPDWALVDVLPNTDLADMTDEPLAALISAVEADVLSEVGNSVTVLRAVVVGRRN